MSAAAAVIGIPTYNRPRRLAALLHALEPCLATVDARVVVADNACAPEVRALVARLARSGWAVAYRPAPERGVSGARNVLVDAFLAPGETAAWLAMLDDDLLVGPDWLARMIQTGERFDADAVGAPCACDGDGMAADAGFVARQSIFATRPRRATGETEALTAAGAILLSRRLLARLPLPAFQPAYGLSGGEDYDFFRRAQRHGARFAWCDEAFAQETVDRERLTAGAVFARYVVTGNYMARIDRGYDGPAAAWRKHAAGLARAVAATALGMLRLSREPALKGVFGTLFNVGGLIGLSGVKLHRYR